MKICYFVYREENVMVYTSQVLEYLQQLKKKSNVEEVGIILFRHEKNMFKRIDVEDKALQYVDWIHSFASLPVLSSVQLRVNALRARKYITSQFPKEIKMAVICRGELAAIMASIAFKGYENVRILFDNRGLPVLESELSHQNKFIYKLNRKQKKLAICYAKDHCDMYNFVTNAMRTFLIKEYGYKKDLPYTIIPTLYTPSMFNMDKLEEIKEKENLREDDLVISYVGGTQSWQSVDLLVQLIGCIGKKYPEAKFLLLTNGTLPSLRKLAESVQERIIKKTVPHCDMPYYLAMTSIGIVIRDDNMVNRVAAPTKIAEYITNGVSVLYKGNIGVIDDLKKIGTPLNLIPIDNNCCWLDKIGEVKKVTVSQSVLEYFDMDNRQNDTLKMIEEAFRRPKIGG